MRTAGRRSVAAVAVCAMSAVSLASAPGCAETDELSDRLSKAQYLIELRGVVAEARQSLRIAKRFDNVASIDQLTKVLDQTVAQFGRIVDRMESIDPPEEVADLHERLTDTLISAEGTLEEANQSLQSGDIAALIGLADEVQGLGQDFATLSADYAERGYDVDPKAPSPNEEFAPSAP